jgi:uncharacterized protein (TIGR00266 family)
MSGDGGAGGHVQPGDHLAVCGTPMSGYGPYEEFELPDRLAHVGSCTLDGVLDDVGAYPGLVPGDSAGTREADGDGVVHAELYRVRDATLARDLDPFEGYDPTDRDGSPYVRERVQVRQPSMRAWADVYDGDPGPSGDWRAGSRRGTSDKWGLGVPGRMDHEITSRPAYAQLSLALDPGESVRTEAGAMVSHSGDVDVETQAEGGLLKSLSRSILGGESFFVNTFSTTDGGSVELAPALSGDVQHHQLDDETLFVQSTSFLASDPAIAVDTEFGGARTFFGGEGLFMLRLSGTGPAFISSYGAIERHEVAPGESLTVDTGHIVAFEESLTFDVRRIGGLRSTLFSGEGLVCEFTGEGTVWTQTRSPDAFLSWLIPKLPTQSGGN